MIARLCHVAKHVPQERENRTHFIVGEPRPSHTKIKTEEKKIVLPSGNGHAFFAPDDNIRKELIQLIDAEKNGVTLAIFLLTDLEITDALARAQKRGVPVELVTDAGCLRERYNKVAKLCEAGCAVYVYNPAYNKKDSSSIMHHKFALFKNNRAGNPLLWTGSFNFTKSGSFNNQENAVVLEDHNVIQQFTKQFDRLKERSYRYGKTKKT